MQTSGFQLHCMTSLLFLLFSATAAAGAGTLNKTTNITDGQTLVSSGGTFVLGFFSPDASAKKYYLGVWYAVSPDAVVWVANRDRPLNDSTGAVLTVSHSGSIVILLNQSSDIVWSSNTFGAAVSPAVQLLDTGNLVLHDEAGGTVLWQSFDHPSNTFLPGMKLGKNLLTGVEWSLLSYRAASDPSPGSYRYVMDIRGSPEIVLWDGENKKYRTGAWNGLWFSGIPEMGTYKDMFDYNFTAGPSEVSYGYTSKPGTPFSRVVLNESGIVQRLVWDGRKWTTFWSALRDQCDSYSKCGVSGVCNADAASVCSCLTGFTPLSPSEWKMRDTSGGCQRRAALDCGNNSTTDGFFAVRGVKLPDTHNVSVDAGIDLEECRRRCLANCSCVAYAAADVRGGGGGSGCVTWSDNLIDVRYVDGGQDLYIRVARSELYESRKKKISTAAAVATASVVFAVLVIFVSLLIWRKMRQRNQGGNTSGTENFDAAVPIFDRKTIRKATKNFSTELGTGGFGIVYEGQLPSGQKIAVKKLSQGSRQGKKEFRTEVELITKFQHNNLVRLLGYCTHRNDRMVVYEHMSNKSLDFHIFEKEMSVLLDWRTRLNIILGIAQGVEYLHVHSRDNVIHRDLKAANILLDDKMMPKISDFGTARLFDVGGQNEMTVDTFVGTRGYMAPEYAMHGKISVKCDVYSFGVLLLEIISGKRNQVDIDLLAQSWSLWESNRSICLLDSSVSGPCPTSELVRCIQIGLLCVQECADDRPTMTGVVQMLNSRNSALRRPEKPLAVCTTRIRYVDQEDACLLESGCTNEITMTDIAGR